MAETRNLQPLSERQWIVTVEGLDIGFRQMTAPKQTLDSTNYTDPTRGVTRQHLSFSSNEDVTLSADADASKHGAFVQWCLERRKGQATVTPFTVTYTAVYADTDGTPYAGSSSYSLTGCFMKSWSAPQVNRAGNGLSNLELVITWDDISVS